MRVPGETMSDIGNRLSGPRSLRSLDRRTFAARYRSSPTGGLGRHTSGHGKGYPARRHSNAAFKLGDICSSLTNGPNEMTARR